MKKLIYTLLSAFLWVGCTEEVIIPELLNHNPRLVIEANIDIDKSNIEASKIQRIKISKTSDFYKQSYPAVLNASIRLTDENGNSMGTFLDINGEDILEDGIYTSINFKVPENDKNYFISIDAEGQNYTAQNSYHHVVEIDSIVAEKTTLFDEVLRLTLFFENEMGVENYFLQEEKIIKIDQSEIPFLPEYDSFDDKFYSEIEEKNSINRPSIYENFETIKQVDFKLYGISEKYQDYMVKILALSASGGGGPFSTAPASIRGNFLNNTNQKDYALGYFSINQYTKKTFTLDKETLKKLNEDKFVKQ